MTNIEPTTMATKSPKKPYNTLFWCLKQGRRGLVTKALEEGVDVNQCNPSGNTPLMKATLYGQLRFVKLLLERGADPFHCNRKGQSLVNWLTWGYHFTHDPRQKRGFRYFPTDYEHPDHEGTYRYLVKTLNERSVAEGRLDTIIVPKRKGLRTALKGKEQSSTQMPCLSPQVTIFDPEDLVAPQPIPSDEDHIESLLDMIGRWWRSVWK